MSLPIEVWEEIFLRVGQASDEELSKLRLVCETWNKSIKMKLRAENPSAEWGQIIARKVKRCLQEDGPLSVAGITHAASLAHQGHLISVKRLFLDDVNLSSIPTEHLSSLASSVTGGVRIRNVSGCGLITILDSVKSLCLYIRSQSMDSEQTRALVRAMESRIENVMLSEDVRIDIRAVMEYSGQGKCEVVKCFYDSAARYKEDLRTWAQGRNWTVVFDDENFFNMMRIFSI